MTSETIASSSTDVLMTSRKKHFIPTAVHYYQQPLQLVRAKGCYVYDDSDREYLDCIGGIVSISAGHNHPKIQARLKAMIETDAIQHVSHLYVNKYSVRLAEKLVSESTDKLNQCAFTNSGSEANELAFMAVRHATNEGMMLNLKHGYHGGTSGVLATCGHGSWRFGAQPVSHVTSVEAPYCYRCPFGKQPDSCALECADAVESTIQTSTHGKIAGMVVEPVMGVGGFIAPPKDYFHKVAAIVHNYGGKYISDEVQTGAGRCGNQFLLTKELCIDADMITMAKGFGNGAPIGAVLMSGEVASSLAGKLYFNTFAGDPYQAMQAFTTMEIIEEENLIDNAKTMGTYLQEGLVELMSRHTLMGDVRGRGLLMGIELVKDRASKEYATVECNELMERCRDKGVLLGKGGLYGNVVRVAPPLSISKKQVNQLIATLDSVLTEMSA